MSISSEKQASPERLSKKSLASWSDAETAAIMDMDVRYYSQRMGIVMTEKGETMRDLTQLNKVEKYLKAKNIPYEREDKEDKLVSIERDGKHYVVYEQMEFHQICVPSRERRDWDVICHRGSYGAEQGLLEIMGTIVRPCGDSVEDWLNADDVIARIEEKRKRAEVKQREKNKSVPESYNWENN